MQGSAGDFYGYTQFGGSGVGTVFRLYLVPGQTYPWRLQILHTFKGGQTDGATPSGLMLLSDGSLVGTAQRGGRETCTDPTSGSVVGCGVAFRLVPPAPGHSVWATSIIHSFLGGKDGAILNSTPLLMGSTLYGVTTQGGAGSCTDGSGKTVGCGTV